MAFKGKAAKSASGASMSKYDLEVEESMNYCKANLKTGNPIIVENFKQKTKINTSKWEFLGYDQDMKPIKFVCEYIEGKKDKSGARVKLLKYA